MKFKLDLKSPKDFFILCMMNFFVFVAISAYLGGDALSGEVVDGRYYLGSHGDLTEVNKYQYIYSMVHVISVFITHPIAIFWGFRDSFTKK